MTLWLKWLSNINVTVFVMEFELMASCSYLTESIWLNNTLYKSITMRPRNGSCSLVKWTAAGRRGRHGRSVMRTVVDIDSASVTVRRHCTTADTVTATTSVPTTARRSSAPVRHADYFAGLQWRQNFYPRTHPIRYIPIPMGILIPTADLLFLHLFYFTSSDPLE